RGAVARDRVPAARAARVPPRAPRRQAVVQLPERRGARGALRDHPPGDDGGAGVSETPTPLPDVVAEADRVISAATAAGPTVRLLGGVGIAAHDHGPVPDKLLRTYGDIDVVTGPKD